jgi:RNA polymerase sigma-70 factor (ECF subfamily)
MAKDPDTRFLDFRRTGDPGALADVFDEAAPELLRLALHFADDPAVAEDLLQETFLVAIRRAESFDPARRVVPWLIGILENLARRERERARRRPGRLKIDLPDADSSAESDSKEIGRELFERIDRLPEPHRKAMLLRYRHGLEPAEIAHLLEVPPATVRSWLHRGRERLRIGLRKHFRCFGESVFSIQKSLPISLMPAWLVARPERGLAAIRSYVLAQTPVAPGVAAGATLLGGILMKKTVAVVVALAALLTGGALILDHAEREDVPARPAPG